MEYNLDVDRWITVDLITGSVLKAEQAKIEGDTYQFAKIPDSHYWICEDPEKQNKDGTKGALYVVLCHDGKLGCTCKHFTEYGDKCEHLYRAMEVKPDDLQTTKPLIKDMLEGVGWEVIDGVFSPPPYEPKKVTAEVVAELPPIDEEPEAPVDPPVKKPLCIATCQYCELEIKAATQGSADKRRDNHEKVCKKRPADKESKPATKEKPPSKKTTPEAPKGSTSEKPKSSKKPKTRVDPPDEPPKKQQPTPTAVSTDVRKMPSDAEFRDAKTGRILQAQGGFYTVAGGKEVPDAMSVQAYAVGKARISTEVRKVEQDADHVLAVIRCHKGDLYTDASVYIDFAIQRKRELLKVANKNPKAVRGWDENGPIFDDEFRVETENKSTPLVVYLFNRMTDFAYFAPRTAESQAARRAQAKMLGTEWRDSEEINTEAEEVSAVNQR